MPYAPSLLEDPVMAALRAFLADVLPIALVDIVQGQINRVASPRADDYVVFWPLARTRLATNTSAYDSAGQTVTVGQATQVSTQVDIHGPAGADNAQVLMTLFRSAYACDKLGPDIQPLYCSDPRQVPFITAENQYEDRWTLDLQVQVNPAVVAPQQSATGLEIDLVEVDV